ncbi:MAG: CrcB family protein [Actinomycetota bacterium]|nr:CrcB family protein [Actinomycetota bacterium]
MAGAAGVLARYWISNPFSGDGFSWATVAINVAGSFLLGVLVSSHGFSESARTVFGVGFLGGFTTFSTFTMQVVLDVESGQPIRALAYVSASLILGLAAATVATSWAGASSDPNRSRAPSATRLRRRGSRRPPAQACGPRALPSESRPSRRIR